MPNIVPFRLPVEFNKMVSVISKKIETLIDRNDLDYSIMAHCDTITLSIQLISSDVKYKKPEFINVITATLSFCNSINNSNKQFTYAHAYKECVRYISIIEELTKEYTLIGINAKFIYNDGSIFTTGDVTGIIFIYKVSENVIMKFTLAIKE